MNRIARRRPVLRRTFFALLACGVAATLGFMLYAGEPGALNWWLFALPFSGWALMPYPIAAFAMPAAEPSRISSVILVVAAACLSASSVAVLYSAFVANPDPQSGLVLVFLPLLQLMGLLPFALVARLAAR